MKWVVFILVLYGIVLFGLYLFVPSRQAPYPPGWVATRNLEANRPLQAGDVGPQGQYLRRAVRKGQAVQWGDLVSVPDSSENPEPKKDGQPPPLVVPVTTTVSTTTASMSPPPVKPVAETPPTTTTPTPVRRSGPAKKKKRSRR
jgi:hypothetical protein